MARDREQLDRVRDRFTRTAREFARFALRARREEAERLTRLLLDDFPDAGRAVALDLACGPATFTRALAPRVRFVFGLDFTPAMLAEARAAAAAAELTTVAFACADASALPLADAALDLGVTGYSVHHFLRPERAITELARVLRHGGRAALADIVVPAGADGEACNRIERARDASHARTLDAAEIHALLEAARLRMLFSETGERQRQFNDWMQVAGWAPGAPAYDETRRLMLASMPADTAGFRPRCSIGVAAGAREDDEIEFTQTTLFVVAEKR